VTGPSPSPEVTVRPATAADVDALVALLVAVAQEGRWIAAEAPVDVEARRRRMVDEVEGEAVERARQAGVHKLALQVWPHNTAAIALYERFGFRREGHLRSHYRRRSGELWDAVVMGLPLD
jgi:RimJ/RimL family protein N-acetyltransferase